MRTRRFLFCLLTICALPFAGGCGSSSSDPQTDRLADARDGIQDVLSSIAGSYAHAAAQIRNLSLDDPRARAVVAGMCIPRPGVIDCSAIDSQGVMRIVEPEAYRGFEGADVSGQEQFQQARRTGEPLLSAQFRTVEGLPAAALQYPVPGNDSQMRLSLSGLLSPLDLCRAVIDPLLAGSEYQAWVMEIGGMILYESDPSQIGLNLFSDPLYQDYPSLIELAQRIAAEPEGAGEYSFLIHGTSQVARKKAQWDTVSLFGTAWRVVIYTAI